MEPATWRFDDGVIPNSRLPVLVHDDVDGAHDAADCERWFARHGWSGAWRDGIYRFTTSTRSPTRYSGIVAGEATVMLGGPSGREF